MKQLILIVFSFTTLKAQAQLVQFREAEHVYTLYPAKNDSNSMIVLSGSCLSKNAIIVHQSIKFSEELRDDEIKSEMQHVRRMTKKRFVKGLLNFYIYCLSPTDHFRTDIQFIELIFKNKTVSNSLYERLNKTYPKIDHYPMDGPIFSDWFIKENRILIIYSVPTGESHDEWFEKIRNNLRTCFSGQ